MSNENHCSQNTALCIPVTFRCGHTAVIPTQKSNTGDLIFAREGHNLDTKITQGYFIYLISRYVTFLWG
jgi:hypothetical protein